MTTEEDLDRWWNSLDRSQKQEAKLEYEIFLIVEKDEDPYEKPGVSNGRAVEFGFVPRR